MSGIAAIINTDGAPVKSGLIAQMTNAMAYRGPDGIAHWPEQSQSAQKFPDHRAALGHCLLRATSADEELGPLVHDESGVVILLDGYLANHQELREELRENGAKIRRGTDVELALHAYLQWGDDAPLRLNGEFACIIWDPRKNTVICLKDHHGLRPLCYHWDGNILLVASEPAAIIAALPKRPELDKQILTEIAIDVCFSHEDTIWKNIKRVLPAHVLMVKGGHLSQRKYWELPQEVARPFKSDGEYIEAYNAVFTQCVREAARSHLPIGCEVSGGLDSTGVFAMAKQLAKHGQLQAPEVGGYTLAGPPSSDADEVHYARAMGKFWNCEIHESPLFLPELEWFGERARLDCDAPPLPNAAMSTNLDQAMVNNGCRVSLSGVGGDQWLDGTRYYYSELFRAREWSILRQRLLEDASEFGLGPSLMAFLKLGPGSLISSDIRRKLSALLRKTGSPAGSASESHEEWLRLARNCLLPEYQEGLSAREANHQKAQNADYRLDYKNQKLSSPRWSRILDQASRLRARTGIESRNPMMLRDFIEFSTQSPEHIRLRGDVTKWIHRQALADILPEEILQRKSKAEFSIAYLQHDKDLKNELCQNSKQVIDTIINFRNVETLLNHYYASPIDERYNGEIWGYYVVNKLLSLEIE